jgi:hypothetical protein
LNNFFEPSEVSKYLVYMLNSVEKCLCESQNKKQWLMAPSSANPPF